MHYIAKFDLLFVVVDIYVKFVLALIHKNGLFRCVSRVLLNVFGMFCCEEVIKLFLNL